MRTSHGTLKGYGGLGKIFLNTLATQAGGQVMLHNDKCTHMAARVMEAAMLVRPASNTTWLAKVLATGVES